MKSGSFVESDGKSMLCHMYAMRAYSFGTKSRQWIGTSGLMPMRRSTWMRSILGERVLDLRGSSPRRAAAVDRLLHDADRDAVGDDVGVLGGAVLDAGGVDGGAVLGRLLARGGPGRAAPRPKGP